MNIERVSKTTNFVVIILIAVLLILPGLMIFTKMNLKNVAPDKFYAVQIEGEPVIRNLFVQDRPTENPEAMKYWVKGAVLYYFNYDANNYINVIKGGRELFTESFYPQFSVLTANRIKQNVANGFYIASSITDVDPILIQKGKIDGDSYYRFYLKLMTFNKSESATIPKTIKVFVTVKFENPEKNVRSIAISDLTIAN